MKKFIESLKLNYMMKLIFVFVCLFMLYALINMLHKK